MTAHGHLALVGSGEYLPVMNDIEGALLDAGQRRTGTRRFVQLATAAAPEGDASLRYWHDLGAHASDRLGAEQVVIDVRTRDDAFNPAHLGAIDDAALIYLSGGNPVFLAATLADTPLWAQIRRAWLSGSSLAGCSAGAMVLGDHVPDLRHIRSAGAPGLNVVAPMRVLPHFDRFGSRIPDLLLRPFRSNGVLVGIDEDTALVHDGARFTVQGRQSAWWLKAGDRQQFSAGESFEAPVHINSAVN